MTTTCPGCGKSFAICTEQPQRMCSVGCQIDHPVIDGAAHVDLGAVRVAKSVKVGRMTPASYFTSASLREKYADQIVEIDDQ